ncbi:acid protease [Ganoderma leucocontextum]|nr:acid protease [Ganoderma leucocontextum]
MDGVTNPFRSHLLPPLQRSFCLLLGLVDGVFGAALLASESPTAQVRTVPFKIARGVESLPQHHIYVVNASVAGVPFEVIIDTGSSDLWIDTSGSEAAFAKGESVKTGRAIMLQYGVDGVHTYARGSAEYADVQLGGGLIGGGLIAYNQSFVNVPGTTNITKYGDKGILGLGPPRGWSVIRETLKGTEWLLDQNPDMEPLFTVEFSSRDSEGMVNNGTLSFGGASPSFAKVADAPKLSLMTGNLWDVPSQGFMVNGEKVNLGGSAVLPFALDTGAYTVCVPPEYMRAIYGSVPGSRLLDDGYWSVPCNAKLNVSMVIANATFPIHPIDMTEVYDYDIQDGIPLCRGLFRNNVDKRIPFLVGLNALQNMYALYSYGDRGDNTPYVQLISNTDVEQAYRDFDIMNAARIKSFVERNATLGIQSASLGGTATQYRPLPFSTELWSFTSPPHPSPLRRPFPEVMYKLIRRISSGFFPRPDRPWSEDGACFPSSLDRARHGLTLAFICLRYLPFSTSFRNLLDGYWIWIYTYTATSTAPQIGRKRRLSTPEPDDEHEREHTPASKKLRAESEADATPGPATPVPETEEVKEVTKGVEEVELEEKPSAAEEVKEKDVEEASAEAKEAAAIPLPDSPQLKATEGEDADADGEADSDVDTEAEVDAKSEEVISTNEDAAAPAGKVEEPPAPTVAVADDEVPGLTLASKSPKKKVETTQAAVLTAQA